MSAADRHVVIVGGGIVGSSIAYFLTHYPGDDDGRRPVRVTVVEGCEPACGASGKAGGFLARDWCSGPLSSLAPMSFDLHAELASRYNGEVRWGYRRVDTFGVDATTASKPSGASSRHSHLPWLSGSAVRAVRSLGDKSCTAQCHPFLLTTFLLDEACRSGAAVRVGSPVIGLSMNDDDGTRVVALGNGDHIQATDVVIASGPWSFQAESWLPDGVFPSGVTGQRAHSVAMRAIEAVPEQVLFTSIRDGRRTYDPEFYPRPDGDVYVCGFSDDADLPDDPAHVEPDLAKCDDLARLARGVSPVLHGVDARIRQACYLPLSPDGWPIIGRVADGVYVATGHSCWGILNGPGTGLVMAEIILEGRARSADVGGLDPNRFHKAKKRRSQSK